MKTRSVAGLGCLLAFLSATACEPDDPARDTGKAGELLAENRTWSRCDFVEGADCYYPKSVIRRAEFVFDWESETFGHLARLRLDVARYAFG